MTTKRSKKQLTEAQIDEIVVRQADDESAWGEPLHVPAKDSDLESPVFQRIIRRSRASYKRDGGLTRKQLEERLAKTRGGA